MKTIRELVNKLDTVVYDADQYIRKTENVFFLNDIVYEMGPNDLIIMSGLQTSAEETRELAANLENLIGLYTTGSFATLVQQAADEKAAETREMLAASYKKQEKALTDKLAKQFSWENPILCTFDGLTAFKFDGHIISVERSRSHGYGQWDWIVWGKCPDCSTEGWSRGSIHSYWIGKMLADFQMDCPACKIAMQETLNLEANSLPNRLVEMIKEVIYEVLEDSGVDYE